MATASLSFDKQSYAPTDTINFTVVVTGAPMTSTVTVTGHVEATDGTDLPAVSTTTVNGVYGPFTATGYTVTQDSTNPALFHAAPSA